MDAILQFISGLIVVFLIIKWFKLPQERCQRLEKLAEEYYREKIEDLKDELRNRGCSKYELYLILSGVLTKKEGINEVARLLLRIQSTKDLYIRLKERRKHIKTKDNIFLYEDWLNYTSAFLRLDKCLWYTYDFGEDTLENYNERVKEIWIEIEEVEKRFKKILNQEIR